MKKFLSVCFSILTFVCLALCLAGCGNGTGGLQYGEKYYTGTASNINKENEAEKSYFVFGKSGKGQYRVYFFSTYDNKIGDYTITFSYTFVDKEKEAVVCTFESVDYGEKHTDSKNRPTDWDLLLTVSENVLMTQGGTLYYSASYLSAHPNFCKEAE